MTKRLQPEDLPSGRGLIPAPEQEAGADILAHNHPGGPWSVASAFYLALTGDAGLRTGVLRDLVTPESLGAWGDFTGAREVLLDACMTSRVDSPAPGVAYVKFVADPGQTVIADGPVMVMARAIATLQYRPESERWLVHALGDYCLPENLPTLPPGSSPSYPRFRRPAGRFRRAGRL